MNLLFRFDDQEYPRRLANVYHLMPFQAIAGETAAGWNIDFPSAVCISDAHAGAGNGVTEMPLMIMPFMTDTWGKGASEDSVLIVVVESLADRGALPAGFQRIWEARARGAGGK